MSRHGSVESKISVTLPVWVHEASSQQNATTAAANVLSPTTYGDDSQSQQQPAYRYGVPLSTYYSSEIILSHELRRIEGLELGDGDLVEVYKANNTSSTNVLADHNNGRRTTSTSEAKFIFKVERGCWAPEGSSGQLKVSHRADSRCRRQTNLV